MACFNADPHINPTPSRMHPHVFSFSPLHLVLFCSDYGCGENELQCNNNVCIDIRLKCNGVDECGDGSDEIDCGKKEFWISWESRNIVI